MGVKKEKNYEIVIAGCGPGAAEYVTPAARSAAAAADVLAGAPRLLELMPNPKAERIPVEADIAAVLDEIEQHAHAGRRVCVLVTGDPGLCSLASPVMSRFGRRACRLIPGISSVQVAFARIGAEWKNAHIINAHGNKPDLDGVSLPESGEIAVLLSRKTVFMSYLEATRRLSRPVKTFLCQDLTLPGERVEEIDPTMKETKEMNISSKSILLIITDEELIQ